MKYLVAVAFVWVGCAMAWLLLGSALVYRSGTMSDSLTREVDSLWGPPLEQGPPTAFYSEPRKVKEKVVTRDAHGVQSESEVEREVDQRFALPLSASSIDARLDLEHRQKGLLWFPTYTTRFHAEYEFHNDTALSRKVDITFPLSTNNAVYDGFLVTRTGGPPEPEAIDKGAASWTATLAPGERRTWQVGYRSRGRSEWRYRLTDGTSRVERYRLTLDTNFTNVNFPAGTLSPTRHASAGSSWRGEWRFDSLVSSAPIGVELPQKLNPGPLASRITFFAPVGLLFFFFVVAVLSSGRREPLHPMHYFFLGCAFFAFHLLFAYLVDHLSVGPSFAVASGVSALLVVSYVRLFRPLRSVAFVFALPQLVYLMLFSATFFWEGYTGLAITVLAVLTLFVIMQITGRVEWTEAFRPRSSQEGALAAR